MSRGTPHRKVRISDDLWGPAREKAARLGTDLSTVIRDLLRKWLDEEG